MSVLVDAGLNQVVKVASGAVDGAIEAVDATQNAVLGSGVQAATYAEDMGDLTMDQIKEAGERFKTLLVRYTDALKIIGNAMPIP